MVESPVRRLPRSSPLGLPQPWFGNTPSTVSTTPAPKAGLLGPSTGSARKRRGGGLPAVDPPLFDLSGQSQWGQWQMGNFGYDPSAAQTWEWWQMLQAQGMQMYPNQMDQMQWAGFSGEEQSAELDFSAFPQTEGMEGFYTDDQKDRRQRSRAPQLSNPMQPRLQELRNLPQRGLGLHWRKDDRKFQVVKLSEGPSAESTPGPAATVLHPETVMGVQKLPDLTGHEGTVVCWVMEQWVARRFEANPPANDWVETDSVVLDTTQGGTQDEWARRFSQREKQLLVGKGTRGYRRFVELIPKQDRTSGDPQTPRVAEQCSKRAFDGRLKQWRILLHAFSPRESVQDADEPEPLDDADLSPLPGLPFQSFVPPAPPKPSSLFLDSMEAAVGRDGMQRWMIHVDKQPGELLGVRTSPETGLVTDVSQDYVVGKFNALHPEIAILPGDRITRVNNVTGKDMWGPAGEIRVNSSLDIYVERPPPSTPAGLLQERILAPDAPASPRNRRKDVGPVASPARETPVGSPMEQFQGTLLGGFLGSPDAPNLHDFLRELQTAQAQQAQQSKLSTAMWPATPEASWGGPPAPLDPAVSAACPMAPVLEMCPPPQVPLEPDRIGQALERGQVALALRPAFREGFQDVQAIFAMEHDEREKHLAAAARSVLAKVQPDCAPDMDVLDTLFRFMNELRALFVPSKSKHLP